jgi:hypothetical protein
MGYTPPGIPSIIETPNIESSKERLRTIDHHRNEAISAGKLAADRMQRRITSTFKPFTLGQKVWLNSKNLRLPFSKKISPKHIGPFVIKCVISKLNYKLELPQSYQIHPVFHATLLSTYHENDIHGPNEIEATPDLIEGQEEYEVARIIKHRERDNQIQYLVSWKNMSHDKNE